AGGGRGSGGRGRGAPCGRRARGGARGGRAGGGAGLVCRGVPRPCAAPPDEAQAMTTRYALIAGQVLSIHVYVEVGSPLGQPGGAVMLRIGIVMMRAGSRIGNGYSGTFLLKPMMASLYPWW